MKEIIAVSTLYHIVKEMLIEYSMKKCYSCKEEKAEWFLFKFQFRILTGTAKDHSYIFSVR